MNVVQWLVLILGAALLLGGAAFSFTGGNIASVIWGAQLLGIGMLVAVIAFAALAPDHPIKLKPGRR
jgi:ABC-type transport system involved in cytochrome c biogenesis permease component